MKIKTPYRFLFAGGGTGGHLYPALAVAQKIRELKPEAEILFIGTKDKIESRVVPEYGFNFKPIPVSGFSRKLTFKNMLFPIKLMVGIIKSLIICFGFKPRVAIGSGAYVSGPAIWAASLLGAKVILLEQNSYPGVTNRLLERKSEQIHISFEESKKYFRHHQKLMLTGNPLRTNLITIDKTEARKNMGIDEKKKTLLVLGGSGGAKTINEAVSQNTLQITSMGIQILWQTGLSYYETYRDYSSGNIKVMAFISDMSSAYSAADLVLARSGATTIAEVSYLGLPVVFVPSNNVAANHQFRNAVAIKNENGAELIEDKNLITSLAECVIKLINDEERLNELKLNIKKFAKPLAAQTVAENAIALAEKF